MVCLVFCVSLLGMYLNRPKENQNIKLVHSIESKKIDRAKALELFFIKRKSPLVPHAQKFVETADKYSLDYRLLVAISCIESSCGKFMPQNSYNAWGWGVYGNNVIRFTSFDEGIEKVAEGLHKGYIAKGADTVEKIAPIYTPPNHTNWLRNVKSFMREIDDMTEA